MSRPVGDSEMIDEKALELGRLLGQSTEYQTLHRAEEQLRADKETVAKLEQIQTLAREVDEVIRGGGMPEEKTTTAYEAAVRELELSAIGQAYVVARANFDKLMTHVNQQISAGIEKGTTSSIITL